MSNNKLSGKKSIFSENMKKILKNLQGWVLSCVWLFATLWTITLQDPLVYEIFQARIV